MSDREEEAVYCYIKNLAIFAFDTHAGDSGSVAKYLAGVAVPENLDVGCAENPLLHSLGSTEHIPPDNHVYLAAKAGQIGCLLACGIPSSNDSHILLTIEEAIAGGTGGNPLPTILALRRKTQIFCGGAGRDYYGIGFDDWLSVYIKTEGAYGKIGLGDYASADLRADIYGLLPHCTGKRKGIHALCKTRIILHESGGCELSSGFGAFIKDWFQTCTRGIYSGGISCRATAYDE